MAPFSSRGLGRSGRSPTRRAVSGRRVDARAWPCAPARAARGTRPPHRPARSARPGGAPRAGAPSCCPGRSPARLPSTLSSAQGLARITSRVRAVPEGAAPPLPGVTRSASAAALTGEGRAGRRWVTGGPRRSGTRALSGVGLRSRPGRPRVCGSAAGVAAARSRESARRPGPDRSASTMAAAIPATASATAARRARAPGQGEHLGRRGLDRRRGQPLRRLRDRLRTGRAGRYAVRAGAEVDSEMGMERVSEQPPPPGLLREHPAEERAHVGVLERVGRRRSTHCASARSSSCAVWKRRGRVPLQRRITTASRSAATRPG